MVKKSVPNFFICPISLRLMKDPVTLSTGQTYDRRSIEKWFEEGHNTCPSTMQVLSNMDIVPNHTIQRLIQHWCASNNHNHGIGALDVIPPTVVPPSANQADRRHVMHMLRELSARGTESYTHLKKLRSLAKDSFHEFQNRMVLVEAGAVPVLANFVFSPESLSKDGLNACEEAVGILTLLPLENIRRLVHIGAKQLTSISWLLNRGTLDGRVSAALLLGSLASDDNEMRLSVGGTPGIFEGLVQLLKEDLYARAVDAGLRAILAILPNDPQRNTVRAVEAGMVFAVVDLLLEADRSRTQVRALTTLMEVLCSCAEGAEAASGHALVVPVLVRIITLTQTEASERALSCLWAVCQHSPHKCVNEAAGQAGILMHLIHLVQTNDHRINPAAKLRATQLLRQLRHKLRDCDSRL